MSEEPGTPSHKASGYHQGSVDTVISVEAVIQQAEQLGDGVSVAELDALVEGEPFVTIDNLYAGYGKMEILHDLSLRVGKGQSLCLIGPNGAGKSTFFKALTGFVRPSRGRIRINGSSVAEAQRHQAVAYVPQSDGVDAQFPVSVRDVVMMGRYGAMNPLRIPRSSDRVAVRDALTRVDLLELADRPLGTLSGG